MNKGRYLATSVLLSAGVLAACSEGNLVALVRHLAMSIPRIRIPRLLISTKIDSSLQKCDRWFVGSGQVRELDPIAC